MKYLYTLKDIARDLNLSTSTVSRAMRDSHEISPETKKLVIDYANKVNYRANPIARSLKERKSNSIGIIVSEIANSFFSQIINGVESVASEKNYQVIISQSHESAERERSNVEYLTSRATDGLLMTLSSETQDIDYLQGLHDHGFPIVFFDRIPEAIDTFKIKVDNRQGAYDVTSALLAKGYRRIGHLANAKALSISRDRLEGYKEALEAYGVAYDESLVEYCNYGGLYREEIAQATQRLSTKKLDAIFLSGDKISSGFLKEICKDVYAPLKDIGIAGFTNSDVVELFETKIISVRQPAFELGQIATEKLIRIIESKHPVYDVETIMLPAEFNQH